MFTAQMAKAKTLEIRNLNNERLHAAALKLIIEELQPQILQECEVGNDEVNITFVQLPSIDVINKSVELLKSSGYNAGFNHDMKTFFIQWYE